MRHDFTRLAVGESTHGLDPVVACPACAKTGVAERHGNGRVEVLHVAEELDEEMGMRVRFLRPEASCELDAPQSASLLTDAQLVRAAETASRLARVFRNPPVLAAWALAIRTAAAKRGLVWHASVTPKDHP